MIDTIITYLMPISFLLLIVYFATRTKYRNIVWDNYACLMIFPTIVCAILVVIQCFRSGGDRIDIGEETEKARQYATASGFTVPSESVLERAETTIEVRQFKYRKERDTATGLWLATYEDADGRQLLDIIGSDGYTLLLCACEEKKGATR